MSYCAVQYGCAICIHLTPLFRDVTHVKYWPCSIAEPTLLYPITSLFLYMFFKLDNYTEADGRCVSESVIYSAYYSYLTSRKCVLFLIRVLTSLYAKVYLRHDMFFAAAAGPPRISIYMCPHNFFIFKCIFEIIIVSETNGRGASKSVELYFSQK
jgi:hypothetical protein